MQFEFYQVDVFFFCLFSGNFVVVYCFDVWLVDELMQMIVIEYNFFEIVFVVCEGEVWWICWFILSVEVVFCGYVILVVVYVLFEVYDELGECLEFILCFGVLWVNCEDEWLVLDFFVQYLSEVGSIVELEQVLGLLLVDVLGFIDKLLVLFEFEEVVCVCCFDFVVLVWLFWCGVIVIVWGLQKDFVLCFFVLVMGVDEDLVIGFVYCSLIFYWVQCLNKLLLIVQQCLVCGGELWCWLEGEWVSIVGYVVLVVSGRI